MTIALVWMVALAMDNPPPRCPIAQTGTGYVLFTDPVHRFCFLYPANYKLMGPRLRASRPFGKGNGRVLTELESERLRNAFEKDSARAAIVLTLSDKAFDLASFVSDAPTGVESPPVAERFRGLTFYKYGAGGGGVSYDDIWYFDLRGKTLRILFDGPFDGTSKSPSAQTQIVERRMLESFRTF